VDRRDAAGGGHGQRRADRLLHLVFGRTQEAVAEAPRGVLAQHARRPAVIPRLDHAARHVQI
jgi:hypothetical protein